MAYELDRKKEGLPELVEHHDLEDLIKPLVKEIHLFDTYVAQTSHLSDCSVLDEITVGDTLTLQREASKFDQNAILILHENQKKLGYIPEKDNVIFARLMDSGKLLRARIVKIEKKGSFTQIAIGIYLVEF